MSRTFYWHIFPSAELQLHAIQYWMRDGGIPSFEQRASVDIHIRMVRVFDHADPADQELAEYQKLVSDVALYAAYLPTDDVAAGKDEPGVWFSDGSLHAELQRARKALNSMPEDEKRRLLELDDVPLPDHAGFTGQPKA